MVNEKRLIELGEAFRMIKNSREDCPETSIKGRAIWETAHNCALSCLTNCDTVDAVEVVRCKDCKHYVAERKHPWNDETGYDFATIEILPFGNCFGQDFSFTEDGELRVNENDFCSYGERREGE